MSLTDREKRLVILVVPALLVALILRFTLFSDAAPATSATGADTIALAQQRVQRLRQLKALVPGRETVVKQTAVDLTLREKGLIPGDTAAQAQAALLEAARRVGKTDQIEIRGGDFPAAKVFGDYGMVFASITFECHVEQLVNFLADLGRQPELMVPSEERISTGGQPKQKMVNVRIVLAGVVAKKLIPEKKGLAAF
jgi:hypothetical protein